MVADFILENLEVPPKIGISYEFGHGKSHQQWMITGGSHGFKTPQEFNVRQTPPRRCPGSPGSPRGGLKNWCRPGGASEVTTKWLVKNGISPTDSPLKTIENLFCAPRIINIHI